MILMSGVTAMPSVRGAIIVTGMTGMIDMFGLRPGFMPVGIGAGMFDCMVALFAAPMLSFDGLMNMHHVPIRRLTVVIVVTAIHFHIWFLPSHSSRNRIRETH